MNPAAVAAAAAIATLSIGVSAPAHAGPVRFATRPARCTTRSFATTKARAVARLAIPTGRTTTLRFAALARSDFDPR